MLGKTMIIGIAGGSGSGKSTLAETLMRTLATTKPPLRVEVFHTDHYVHQDKSQGPNFFSPSAAQEQFDWNHPQTVDNARLLVDIDARLTVADAPDVILLEGLMVLHVPEIRDRLDLRLFIELEADERVLRRLLRNIEKGQNPQFIADYYRESARIGHARFVEPSRIHADFIIRGDADFQRIGAIVARIVPHESKR